MCAMASSNLDIAPPLQVSEWLNTPQPISLAPLRGRVVVLHAFQMLCPACVAHGLPPAASAAPFLSMRWQ